MTLFRRLLEIPFFEQFLPDRLKPLNEDFLNDQYSKLLLSDAKSFIDNIIHLTETQRFNRTFKHKTTQAKFLIKIKQNRIKLDISDLKRSEAPIKKRIIIDMYRKLYKQKNGKGKIVEATVYYSYQCQSYTRSGKYTNQLGEIFDLLHALDESLSGIPTRLAVTNQDSPIADTDHELSNTIQQLRKTYTNSLYIDPLLEIKLKKTIENIEKLLPSFGILDIEDRHVIKRSINEDIPQLMNSYLQLNNAQQLEQKEKLTIALARIELKMAEYVVELERLKVEQIEHLLRLNEVRYNSMRK